MQHKCPSCGWAGSSPEPFGPGGRDAHLAALPAGARIPSGLCPSCGAGVLPEATAPAVTGELPDGGPLEAGAWRARATAAGGCLAVNLWDPVAGRGCEFAVRIVGERPLLTVTPHDQDGYPPQGAILAVSVGRDHAVASSPIPTYASAIVADRSGLRSTRIGPRAEWQDVGGWTDVPG